MARWSSQTTHTDIGDFSENPDLRKELKKWRLKIATVILLIIGGVGFSVKPAYRAYRSNRIDKNLEAAKVAARLEDWGTARDLSRSVLLARQSDLEAFRIWTRALGKMGEPRTYLAAAQLFGDGQASKEDKLECLQVMAIQAPQAVALSAYASLPPELRNQAAFRAALTPLLVSRGEVEIAEKGLREVMGDNPSPEVRLELMRTLCARPDTAKVEEARRIFAQLMHSDSSEVALAALLMLGDVTDGLAPDVSLIGLPEWVKKQQKATTLHHLLALHPSMLAEPDAAEGYINQAIERFLDNDPGVLGTWLVRHGKAEKAAQLLEEPAKTRGDAYVARLHALLREGKESDLSKLLSSPPPSADLVEVEMVRASLAKRGGDEIAASTAWTRSLNQAAFDITRNRFIEIARVAEMSGARATAQDAWVAAVRSGWGPLPLYRDLLPVFTSLAISGRSEDLMAMYRSLLRLEPLNVELSNNFNYLALIHGMIPASIAADTFRSLIEKEPERTDVLSGLMLAELEAGKPVEALALLPAMKASRTTSPMMIRALEGSALVMNGESEKGVAVLRAVEWRLFMRQERIAFRELLITFKVANLPLPDAEVDAVQVDPSATPAWRKAVEKMEKDRAGDVLPALPAPRLPSIKRDEN